MNRPKALRLTTGFAVALALAPIAACTPMNGPPAGTGTASMHEETMQARVIGVDYAKRFVALRGPAGNEATVVVGPEVKNFDQIRIGDTVTVVYREALAVRVRGGSTPLPGIVVSGGAATAAPGQLPAGIWSNQATRTVQVLATDPAAHTVTYRDVDGAVFTIVVQDPNNWPLAAQLTPGTLVDVTNFQTIAAAVTKS